MNKTASSSNNDNRIEKRDFKKRLHTEHKKKY